MLLLVWLLPLEPFGWHSATDPVVPLDEWLYFGGATMCGLESLWTFFSLYLALYSSLPFELGTRQHSEPVAYCGVYAVARAIRSQGREINFVDLLRPEYIGSKRGSSLAELSRAVTDHGLYAKQMDSMTAAMLQASDCPVLLHVRRDFRSLKYDHWVLFMGTEDGKAVVYDGKKPLARMAYADVAARWDGVGLLISSRPIDPTRLYLELIAAFLTYAALVAGVATVGMFLFRGFLPGVSHRTKRLQLARCLAEACCLLVISGMVYAAVLLCRGESFLASEPAMSE
jgi:hypothetical protein